MTSCLLAVGARQLTTAVAMVTLVATALELQWPLKGAEISGPLAGDGLRCKQNYTAAHLHAVGRRRRRRWQAADNDSSQASAEFAAVSRCSRP